MTDENKKNTVKRICKNGMLLAILCIVGMFSIPLGPNIKLTLQLLIVFIVCLLSEGIVDSLIIVGSYVIMGLFLPIYAGFSSGISPTFGFVISFIVITPVVYFLNKIIKLPSIPRMSIACFVGLIICYLIGSIFMSLYLQISFWATLAISVLPYIAFDILKLILAVFLAHWLQKLNNLNKNLTN